MMPRYPNVEVQLIGGNGNAFAIIGSVMETLRRAGVSLEERQSFQAEAMSGDYDNVLQTAMRWVECL